MAAISETQVPEAASQCSLSAAMRRDGHEGHRYFPNVTGSIKPGDDGVFVSIFLIFNAQRRRLTLSSMGPSLLLFLTVLCCLLLF